jgi:hypothetical protein
MAGPRLSDVLSALTAAAVVALPDVTVVDGPVVSSTSSPKWLFVGANDTPGQPGATMGDGAGDALPEFVVARTMSLDVTIQTWSGGTDVPARRVEAEAILDVVEGLLRPDAAGLILGLSTVAWVRLGSVEYTPRQLPTGASVTLVAAIELQARAGTR